MDLSFMQNELVMALCWTLIHSLWQGLLLATVTGAVMIGTRKSGADKRYRILTFLFFAFVAIAAITFIKEYKSIAQQNKIAEAAAATVDVNGFTAVSINESQAVQVQATLLERFKDYFNTHASLIVLIWFVIFIARFIRLAANLVYVDRLKHYKTAAPSLLWLERFKELVEAIGLRKKIRLLESGIVKVPVAMGVFKPVILLPMGLLAHLPADEIEAILLHELAHIKRRDYLVNLLQNFAETIFFFNPALMWVSSMIREERENCCDDIAISVTNNKSNFIKALIAFQEYNIAASRYVVGFPGSRNQLLNRVKRIVHEKNKTLNAAEKSLLTLGIGIFILFSFAAAKKIAPGIIKENSGAAETSIAIEPATEKAAAANAMLKHPEEPIVSIDRALIAEPGTKEWLDPSSLLQLQTDTTPVKSKPLKLSGRTVFEFNADAQGDSTSNLFTGISINRKAENNQDYVITATAKTGTEYKVHKVDGVVKEVFVDGVQAGDPSAYQSVVDNLERAINFRQQQLNYRWTVNAAEQRRLIDLKTKEIAAKQHYLDSTRKMQGVASMQGVELKHRQAMLDQLKDQAKQQSIKLYREDSARVHLRNKIELQNRKISMEADSIHFDENKKTFTLKGNAKLENKEPREKGGGYEVTADDIRYVVDSKKQNSALSDKKADRKSQVKISIGTKEPPAKELARLNDSLHRLTIEKQQLAALSKESRLKELMLEDEARMRRSARLMKEIIADLEKEGVRIDVAKSWFALDKSQFVVDGKAMPAAMHQKFIARYVTSHEGWGYYYGPVKTTGRGIFLDYASISK